MLYLIRTFGRGNKTAIKIGYTDNLDTRKNQYYIHNPFYEPISSREGTLEDETKMHLYLKALGYKQNFLNEWFEDRVEVLQEFHAKSKKINKVIWKNRDKLFSDDDFRPGGNKIKQQIYNKLKQKYDPDLQKFNDIDFKIKLKQTRELLKRLKNNLDLDT